MTMRKQYALGAQNGGWMCRHCNSAWMHKAVRHRRRTHYVKTYARFVAHKMTNWRCHPFSYKVDGLCPAPSAWRTWRVNDATFVIQWRGESDGRIAYRERAR